MRHDGHGAADLVNDGVPRCGPSVRSVTRRPATSKSR
ncbi:hypothetical protein STAFG_4924 [Streptomyces afghaniensis 772]|uniref:Uncharacterized protein n=1 Tax=Streptomyces afghaniensis 772 TaxID=1283301 RepID=S4MQX9_9ACTN|nr:hypothetical protein STAFG_4924 [Streptomyces afghaniensis 772]